MIRKCLGLGAIPVLVTRKTAFITRVLCERVGIFTFQVHRQLFSEAVGPFLGPIQHKNELGYKDVIAVPIQPYPPLVRFLGAAIPARLDAHQERWQQYRDVLQHFAVELKMGDSKTKDSSRHALYPKLWGTLFPRDEEAEEEGPPDDLSDYDEDLY
jgi:hypothetical protein